MTMTGRRLLLTSCLFASALGLVSPAPRAQSFPMNLEGYAVADQVAASPARSTVALVAPYRAVGLGTNLMIVDETLPAHPVVVSQVSLASPALDMLYRDGRLYIAAGTAGLFVMDVSHPLTPTFLSSVTYGSPVGLAMNEGGKILYVCDGNENIQVFNIQKSDVPKRVAYLNFQYARITDLQVVGTHLIAAAGPKGLIVYTLERPGRPIRIKHFKDLTGAMSVSACPDQDGLFAVADAYDGLVFVNFPTWTTPAIKGKLATAAAPTWARYLPGTSRVLVGLGAAGYAIADGSDPANPTLLSQPATPSPVMSLTTDGSLPYLLCSGGGMYTVNVSNPSAPVSTLAFAASENFGALARVGSLVYISRGSSIEVWDCSDPYHLMQVGSVPSPSYASDLLVSGDLLFAGCQQNGLAIFSVSNPLSPALLSVLPVSGSAGQMDIWGNLLAVAVNSGGVLLVDVTVPAAPVAYSNPWLGKNDYVAGVAFSSATTLWARGNVEGLTALNVTSPSSPASLGKLAQDNVTGRIYLYGTYIIGAGGGACPIVSTANPAKPDLTTTIPTNSATAASFDGTTMFLSDGATGFSEVDLSTITAPVINTRFGSPTYTYQGVPLPGGARLVSAREGGLWSLIPSSCEGIRLYLPCDNDTLSPLTKPLFTWAPVSGAQYTVEFCQSPTFPSEKTISSSSTDAEKKIAYYQPGDTIWKQILKKARNHDGRVYWRVIYKVGSAKTRSEVRTILIP